MSGASAPHSHDVVLGRPWRFASRSARVRVNAGDRRMRPKRLALTSAAMCRGFGSCIDKRLQQWLRPAVISSRADPGRYVLQAWMKSSAALHIPRAHIVLEKLTPSAEVIRQRHSAWVLHRRGCVLPWVCGQPLRISDGLVDSGKAGDFTENRGQMVPCKVVQCHLKILPRGLL